MQLLVTACIPRSDRNNTLNIHYHRC